MASSSGCDFHGPRSPRPLRGCRLFAPLLAVAMCVALAGVAPVHGQNGDTLYTLRPRYTEGDVNHYRIEFHTVINRPDQQAAKTDLVLAATMKETTKTVKPDGTVIITDDPEEAYAKFGDFEMDATAALPHLTQTRDRDGRVTAIEAKGKSGPMLQAGDLLKRVLGMPLLFYPPHSVRIGDSWKIDVNDKLQGVTVSGTGTVLGLVKIGSANTLKISVSTDARSSDTSGAKAAGSTDAKSGDKDDPKATDSANGATGNKADIKVHFEGVGNIDAETGQFIRMSGITDGAMGRLGSTKSDFSIRLDNDATGQPEKGGATGDRSANGSRANGNP